MSLRYGIKESDQLRVCCVFKSLCVFILFTPERTPLSLLKEQTQLWLFPPLLFDPRSLLGPPPKPCPLHWLGCSDSGGLLGREPAEVYWAISLSPPPTCSTPPLSFHSGSARLMGLLFFSYCSSGISYRAYHFVPGTIFSLLLRWQKWVRIVY